MSGEYQEKPASAKWRQVVSFTRLERKVDALTVEVAEDRKATNKNTQRLDLLNMNGSAVALKKLAENTDHLIKLAEVAPIVIEAVERDTDMRIFWKVLRRFLNPLKPVGALLWAGFVTLATAIVWNIATSGHTLFHH